MQKKIIRVLYVYEYIHMYMNTYTYIHKICLHSYAYDGYTYKCTYICKCIYIFISKYISICIYIYIYIYTCIYIYMYTYIYIYIYTCPQGLIYVQSSSFCRSLLRTRKRDLQKELFQQTLCEGGQKHTCMNI